MKTNITVAVASCLAVALSAQAGPDWDEICDAGSLIATAQPISGGGGSLKSIKGALAPCSPLAGAQPDLEDMYQFIINDPTMFCAKTVAAEATQDCCGGSFSPVQGTNFDTQIWLFKANGLGLLANNNDPADPPLSRIGNVSNDGSGAMILTPGVYYLAISGANRVPVSSGGQIFQFGSPFEVSGPDGPGGGNPITGWVGPGQQGHYEIVLCAARTIQGIPTVSQWGLVAMAAAMLAGGAIIIARRGHPAAA